MIILIPLVSFYIFNVTTRKLNITYIADTCGFTYTAVGLDRAATHAHALWIQVRSRNKHTWISFKAALWPGWRKTQIILEELCTFLPSGWGASEVHVSKTAPPSFPRSFKHVRNKPAHPWNDHSQCQPCGDQKNEFLGHIQETEPLVENTNKNQEFGTISHFSKSYYFFQL